jgi:hypothetical protein
MGNNIDMNLKEIGWEILDRISLPWSAVLKAVRTVLAEHDYYWLYSPLLGLGRFSVS